MYFKDRMKIASTWLLLATLPIATVVAIVTHTRPASAATSTTPVALTPWSQDPNMYAMVGANNTSVHAWGMRTTPDAWGTGPMDYESGATTTYRGSPTGSVSFNLMGTYCPGGVCSFGTGTGYKAFVQIWNNPTNYIAFGLIHDPGVSPNGTTIMVEGAANGNPVGGYWAPGGVPGTFHSVTATWGSQGVLFTMDGTTLGWYPLTITYPSISFVGAGRADGDIVDATFTNITFNGSFTAQNSAAAATEDMYIPPNNPPANITPNPLLQGGSCSVSPSGVETCTSPCIEPPSSATGVAVIDTNLPSCIDGWIAQLNQAHADEGIAPLQLPGNFASLSIAEEIFILVNLERVDRGLPPYIGLTQGLDASAQSGANQGTDPYSYPSGYQGGGSVWAGGISSADEVGVLMSVFGWVYEDGWGGSQANTFNFDCTSPTAQGCWGHRDVLLGMYVGVQCTNCVMGAAFANNVNGWPSDYTGIIGEPLPGYTPHYVYTWQQAVAAGAGTA